MFVLVLLAEVVHLSVCIVVYHVVAIEEMFMHGTGRQ